jgi:hypothetical protein
MTRAPGGTWIALLRGLNVGGKNRLAMADLAAAFEAAGAGAPRTFIQSGNVLFEAPAARAPGLAEAARRTLASRHGLEVPVVLRSAAELAAAVEAIAVDTYISPPFVGQAMVHEFLRRGSFEPNLEVVCSKLKLRRDAMLSALEREFPEGTSWSRPEGGYFNWLDLPAGVDAGELLVRATEAGVTYCKGTDFYPDGRGAGSLRLAYSYPSPEEIEQGLAILAELAKSLSR